MKSDEFNKKLLDMFDLSNEQVVDGKCFLMNI